MYLVNGGRTKEDMVQIQARLSTGESQHIWKNWETSLIPPPKKKITKYGALKSKIYTREKRKLLKIIIRGS